MDLRGYLLLLRRGALTILAALVLSAVLAVVYLQAAPKVYQGSAELLIFPSSPKTLGELQLGGQYAQSSAPTIATLIGTAAVLRPVSVDLRSDGSGAGLSPNTLAGMVGASAVESSAVVTISVTAPDAGLASTIANAVASRATTEIPDLTSSGPTAGGPHLSLRVIQRAQKPEAPASPNSKRVVVLFQAMGLALGLAVTLLRQSLDNRLRESGDVAAMTQVPVLATLARGQRRERSGIVVRDAPSSPSVEGYRVLRTNLRALAADGRGSVVVAAASHDPAAVQIPVNLAWSLAQTGRRVLLVDLDLRHSSVANLFDLAGSTGAADVLTGDADFADAVQITSSTSIDVLTGGVAAQAPSDLLSGHVLGTMVARAEAAYDYVVVHAPALLRYTDAAVVAATVSETVIVVRSGYTQAPDLTRAMGVLANVGVAPLGIVLSDAKMSVADNLRARDTRPIVKSPSGQGVGREVGKGR